MNDDVKDPGWPDEAGELEALPLELEPPPGLEEKVTRSLLQRGLISAADGSAETASARWPRAVRSAFAAAASVLLVALGFLGGRWAPQRPSPASDEARRAQYALLLYETPGYDRAEGAEELERYLEYSRWVAVAREREQFVTGEDLEVDGGWIVSPSEGGAGLERGVSVASAPPLSGIFLVTGSTDAEVLALAEELPHLRHGGQVIVQRTTPTDAPPQTGG